MKYRLTTISLNEKARSEVYEQLVALIGDRFAIESLCYTDYKKANRNDDKVVLITTPPVMNLIKSQLQSNCKYFIAKRTINPSHLGLILNIPAESEVLVVNNLYENALEVIAELACIGVNHIRLVPYDFTPNSGNRFRYAITPGEGHLVPSSIPNVVDIGNRLISLTTIAQILFYCTGDSMDDDFLYSRYIRDLVSLSFELSRQVKRNDMLQQQMKTIISNSEDGIIVTEADKIITFHNEMASAILNKKPLIGKSLYDLHILQNNGEYSDTAFTYIDDKVIHVTTKEVALDKTKKVQMITLKDLTTIKKIDEQYKRQKKYTEYNAKYTFNDIVYKSAAMSKAVEIAKRLAQRDSTILITGESGTGKELIAQSIHNTSIRSDYPFIAINCAALSDSLLESELFGYEEGAFTGARKGGKRGIFELADDGTIFLDEIGDAPPSIQKKLLRVLQEKEIMRVSGTKVIPINVRVIAATNKDLHELVEQGMFRKDLYYRLNVLSLHLPPLRERTDDIELLLYYFIHRHGATNISVIDTEVLECFLAYSWPGNIRELDNIAEYIAAIYDTGENAKEEIMHHLMLHHSAEKTILTAKDRLPEKLFSRDPRVKKDLMYILEVLHEAKSGQVLIGRYKIQEILQSKCYNMTIQQVKTRLDMLRKAGFIVAHNGKGSVLTAEGEKFLHVGNNRETKEADALTNR
jgi:transcriptional regulator with PAS, ATPase and Fis domain